MYTEEEVITIKEKEHKQEKNDIVLNSNKKLNIVEDLKK